MSFFQILPQTPGSRLAEQLGQSLGIGLGKRLGLQEAQQMAETAEGDPVKLAFSLAKASTFAPELQRSLGQIYEQLLARTQSGQLAQGLSKEGEVGVEGIPTSLDTPRAEANPDIQGEINPKGVIPPSPDVPSNASPIYREQSQENPVILPANKKLNANEINNVSQQFLMNMRPDLVQGTSEYGRVPTFNYEMKSNLRPEEEAQIRQDLINRGIAPQVQDKIIEKTRNDIQARYNEMLKAHNLDVNRQKDIKDKWSTFKQQSDENLLPLLGKYSSTYGFGGRPRTANDLRNKYFQYAGNLPVDLTPEQMNAQAGAMLRNDINKIDAIAALPGLPFIRSPLDVDKYLEDKKKSYKDLVNQGFYETVKEDAANKDMGLEELHDSIWGDQTDKNSLNRLSIFQAPKLREEIPGRFGLAPQPKFNKNYSKQQDIYLKNISEQLTKIKPDDDLILLRAAVLNSGGTEKDFNDSLDNAIEKGLKLSPFQESQRQEALIPRKRPIWEIFNPKAWRQWLNLSMGKR